MLSSHQIGLLIRTSKRPRKTVKFCSICHGKHAGRCELVLTRQGTRCRADILDIVEARHRERNA